MIFLKLLNNSAGFEDAKKKTNDYDKLEIVAEEN